MLGYNVIDISSYIIEYSNEIGSPVSNLKLQKLLYYSQAAMLVELGQKCFDSKIMAWEFGPVVVEAYQHYKEYGRDVIPNQEDCKRMKLDGKTMKVWEADVLDRESKEEPGTIVEVTKKEIIISPVSRPFSIYIVVTPVTVSPSMIARSIGAAPRYFGSSDA